MQSNTKIRYRPLNLSKFDIMRLARPYEDAKNFDGQGIHESGKFSDKSTEQVVRLW
jgi:hypothetical protein